MGTPLLRQRGPETRHGTALVLETFVPSADRQGRQVTTSRDSSQRARRSSRNKRKKRENAPPRFVCAVNPSLSPPPSRARGRTRRAIIIINRSTSGARRAPRHFWHSRRGQRRGKEGVMRRQRHRTGRAVRRYFCIITDTVASVADHHGGEVQGTWIADRDAVNSRRRRLLALRLPTWRTADYGRTDSFDLEREREREISLGWTTGSQRELVSRRSDVMNFICHTAALDRDLSM